MMSEGGEEWKVRKEEGVKCSNDVTKIAMEDAGSEAGDDETFYSG